MVRRRNCAVVGCSGESSTRHRFPNPEKSMQRYQEWLRLCGNRLLPTLNPNLVYQSHRVCHIHFRSEDKASNMYLQKSAVPSLHLPASLISDPEATSQETCTSCVAEVPSLHLPASLISDPEATRQEASCTSRVAAVPSLHLPASMIYVATVTKDVNDGSGLSDGPAKESSQTSNYLLKSVKLCEQSELVDVCRICLKPTSESKKLSQQNHESILYERMVEFVFPDLNINMYPDPAICMCCEAELQRTYDFKKLWSRSEYILQAFVSKQTQVKGVDKSLLLDLVAGEKLLELVKDPGNKDVIVDDLVQDAVDVEIAGQDPVRNGEVLEDSVKIPEDSSDDDDVEQITPDEHTYCQPISLLFDHDYAKQTTSTYNIQKTKIPELVHTKFWRSRKKLPIPDINNLLDEKYDEYFSTSISRNLKYAILKQRLRKLRRPDLGEPPYLCEICGHVFKLYVQYQRHVGNHKRLQSRVDFVCDICGLSFSNTNIRDHYSTHKPRNYTCSVCNRKFLGALQLLRHAESGQHEREKHRQCHLCGKKVTRHALKYHLLSHRTVQCQVCEKVLSKSAMYAHLKWHREGGYKCPRCMKVLRNKYCLNIHIMAVHDKNEDFKCGVCGKGYSLRCRLKRHIIKTHMNSNQQKENVSVVAKSQEEIWMEADNET